MDWPRPNAGKREDQVWQWLSDNSETINVALNFFMLIVWALYFQLLLNAQQRQRRAKILINRTAGHTLSANCLITNMSAEPIYLEAVVVEFQTPKGPSRCSLTDLDTLKSEPDSDVRREWFQGPLMNGDYVDIGSFDHLLCKATEGEEEAPQQFDAFDLIVIATYGPDHEPVVARRPFHKDDGQKSWHAGATEQVRWKAKRRSFASYMRESG